MPKDRSSLILGFLLVGLGGGWLLSSLGFIPPVDWAWTLGLAVVAVLAVALSGFDKVSFVVSGFFGLASMCSVLRQVGARLRPQTRHQCDCRTRAPRRGGFPKDRIRPRR